MAKKNNEKIMVAVEDAVMALMSGCPDTDKQTLVWRIDDISRIAGQMHNVWTTADERSIILGRVIARLELLGREVLND